MRFPIFLYIALLYTPLVCAQEPVAAIAGDQPVIALYGRLAEHAVRLQPLLAQLKTDEWVAKGASETYSQQTASAILQLGAVRQDMTELQKRPEALQESMKALFRLQAFHRTLDSLIGGLRRYQNPALADLTQAVASEDAPDIQILEAWLLEVADRRDREYQVVEKEAQRCRGTLTGQPAPRPAPARRLN